MFSRFAFLATKYIPKAKPLQIRKYSEKLRYRTNGNWIEKFSCFYGATVVVAAPITFTMQVYENKKKKGTIFFDTRAEIMTNAAIMTIFIAPFWPIAIIAEILDI